MSKYYVNHLISEGKSGELKNVTLDLNTYCRIVITKIFNAINHIEKIQGRKISTDDVLKSNFFDAIGMLQRLPMNIHEGDDKS